MNVISSHTPFSLMLKITNSPPFLRRDSRSSEVAKTFGKHRDGCGSTRYTDVAAFLRLLVDKCSAFGYIMGNVCKCFSTATSRKPSLVFGIKSVH